MISRSGGGHEERWLSIPALRDLAAAHPSVSERLRLLCAQRAPFAGIPVDKPAIMGVVNATPDSFSGDGLADAPDAAAARGAALAKAGAALIDVGGESTRPGAEPTLPAVERGRVLPVVSRLAAAGVKVSIDTRNPGTMRAALAAGAVAVNDISALTHDPDSLAAVGEADCGVVLMHSAGDPRTMQDKPRYDDAALDIFDYFAERIAVCEKAGIARTRLALDFGFGFGKIPAHNMRLIDATALFHGLGCALLVGASRKSTIAHFAGSPRPAAERRLPGSLALALAAWDRGAQMVRVHDVAETAQARALWQALAAQEGGG